MKKSFLPIIIFLTIISCGTKRVVTGEGVSVIYSDSIYWQTYTENDSAFRRFYFNPKGPVFIEGASSEPDLKDSTFVLNAFLPNGRLIERRFYLHGREDGEWLTYNADGSKDTRRVFKNGKHVSTETWYPGTGRKKSRTVYSDGFESGYETWYESGKKEITGELLPDSAFRHREYFENGLPKKEMTADKTGKGQSTYYYANGKIHETGPIANFNRSGVWKIYDTLGNVKQDTLFGIK
jgi:antitoxin component YwqK of YwqJK toxin-antitoxin module